MDTSIKRPAEKPPTPPVVEREIDIEANKQAHEDVAFLNANTPTYWSMFDEATRDIVQENDRDGKLLNEWTFGEVRAFAKAMQIVPRPREIPQP